MNDAIRKIKYNEQKLKVRLVSEHSGKIYVEVLSSFYHV